MEKGDLLSGGTLVTIRVLNFLMPSQSSPSIHLLAVPATPFSPPAICRFSSLEASSLAASLRISRRR